MTQLGDPASTSGPQTPEPQARTGSHSPDAHVLVTAQYPGQRGFKLGGGAAGHVLWEGAGRSVLHLGGAAGMQRSHWVAEAPSSSPACPQALLRSTQSKLAGWRSGADDPREEAVGGGDVEVCTGKPGRSAAARGMQFLQGRRRQARELAAHLEGRGRKRGGGSPACGQSWPCGLGQRPSPLRAPGASSVKRKLDEVTPWVSVSSRNL